MVMVTPDRFRTIACPTYPEIRLAVGPAAGVARMIEAAQPCAIHIATEGPLGWAARRYCLRRKLPFTTAYHTRFPEYLQARFRVPLPLSYAVMRRFHHPSSCIMVATQGIEDELVRRGFGNIRRWSRGVDTELFRPRPEARGEHGPFAGLPRPIFLYVGRVAVEKNIEAFLALDLPGTKAVVGDGPLLDDLRRRHPQVHFAGARLGEDLAVHYAGGDVFVFPSRTDTFGLVLLEALASGLPVAAYPVPGPADVIGTSPVGALDEDLERAALIALTADSIRCRDHALGFSWAASARQFMDNLRPFETPAWRAAE
ncbi:putative glycosyl transferase (Group 1) [Magnetospirillum sp. SS-4]|nr:putative glycosyl transferase (Group 1) [Magnetospirillum sp. SS-4]